MKKRLFSILLALTLCLSLLPMSTLAAEYSDIEGHWAEEAIVRWSDRGMLQGSNGQFRPYGTLTRAHMATMLARLLALPEAESAGFSDTGSHWAEDAIDRCAAAGILLGEDGRANPDAPITRQQAMTMLCRALQYRQDSASVLRDFADASQVSGYAQGYLAALVNDGAVLGHDGRLEPLSYINRGQMVAIIDRMIRYYANGSGQTISAEDGGMILVVAKNVTLTDVPADATVLVTESAPGLKVNGVAVAPGQTYAVPEVNPATTANIHRHSFAEAWSVDDDYHWHDATCGHDAVSDKAAHSYDAATGRCVCGQTDLASGDVVARVNGVKYDSLADAIAAAQDGDTVLLAKNVTLDGQIVLDAIHSITIDGNGNTLRCGSSEDNQAVIRIDGVKNDATITLKNLTLIGSSVGNDRALSFHNNSGKLVVNVDNCELSAGHYAFNIGSGNTDFTANITNSTITGCAAIQTWSANSKITATNSTLTGNNDWEYKSNGDNDFDTIVVVADAAGTELTFNNCIINANQTTGNKQGFFDIRTTATVSCNGCTFNKNGTAVAGFDAAITDAENYFPSHAPVKESNTRYSVVAGTRIADGVVQNTTGEYLISSVSGLQWMHDALDAGGAKWTPVEYLGKTFKLTADIDASSYEWKTVKINYQNNNLDGIVFDGQNHTITGLTIKGTALFGGIANGNNSTKPAKFQNVTFDGVTVNSPEDWFVAVIWGHVSGDIELTNVHVKNASVTGCCNVGGLIGRNSADRVNSTIKFTNCSVTDSAIVATWQKDGYDPVGAGAFLGCALDYDYGSKTADVALTFSGNNSVTGTTTTTKGTTDATTAIYNKESYDYNNGGFGTAEAVTAFFDYSTAAVSD